MCGGKAADMDDVSVGLWSISRVKEVSNEEEEGAGI
jgi:hypothetical protein